MNWQPIETAPKDGSEILVAIKYSQKRYETFFLYWITSHKDFPEGVWAFDYETPVIYGEPAYWMEVPEYEPTETES